MRRMHRKLMYEVQITEHVSPWGMTRHLKVTCPNSPDVPIPWEDLQHLKDEYLGPETLAVEIYPPADRLVNEISARHLWEVPEAVLPIGFRRRD